MGTRPPVAHTFCRKHGPNLGPCLQCLLEERAAGAPPHQHYWRCAHHTSAIQNFFEPVRSCGWGCHATELHWYHGGFHPMPKSWGTPVADRIFGQ